MLFLSCGEDEQPTLSEGNDLILFRFESVKNPSLNIDINGVIDNDNGSVELIIPDGVIEEEVSQFIATFEVSTNASVYVGETRQVSGESVNDFKSPVNYIIRAENGTEQVYRVSVTNLTKSDENDFLTFSFQSVNNTSLNEDFIGEINVENRTIEVLIPEGSIEGDSLELIATFDVDEMATVYVGEEEQISGQSINNFSETVTYKVVAENGDEAFYSVNVSIISEDSKYILSLTFPVDLNPNLFREPFVKIDSANKTVRFHNPQVVETNLIPVFELSEGAKLFWGDIELSSGISIIDFTEEITVDVVSAFGRVTSWRLLMTREIVDIEDFLRVCPLEDPNINLILDDFEFRLNGQIIGEFPCAEPYYIMEEPTANFSESEYYKETTMLQTLRFLYYLDYDDPYIIPWAGERLYDWVGSKIDGINIVDGISGGVCCRSFDGKTFISVGNTRTDDGQKRSAENLYWGFRLLNMIIILHEARHVDGFPHSSCCGIANGCDDVLNLNNPSAYATSVWWTQVQYEGIYDFDACSIVKDGRAAYGDRIQLSSIFDPNIWSNRFCSGTYTYEFPEEVLRACD
ncbi:hypothetical protein D3A96_09830 [Robertkochia marina]|nr:hypothetical protein D3A96_09830 [Robertkochia marina]